MDNLTFDSYQQQAWTTALYPNKGSNLYYPALGLASEIGEVLDLFTIKEEEFNSNIKSEIADVFWYLAAMCTEMSISLNEIASGYSTFADYQGNNQTDDSLERILFKLGAETGKTLGKVKKVMRDYNGELNTDMKNAISERMAKVLWLLCLLSNRFDFSLSEMAQKNLDKLFDRQKRGVIKGSGDNR